MSVFALAAAPVLSIVPILTKFATLVAHAILPILAKFAIFAARATVAVLAIVEEFTIVAIHATTHAIVIALTFLAAHTIQIPVVFAAPPAILTTFLILAAVLVLAPILIVVIGGRFFGTSDNSPRSYPHPSPRHHETTRLLHRPPIPSSFTRNSYARSQSQTADQTPAILHGPNSARESCQATSTSAHSRASYQHPPSPYPVHNLTPVCILISIYRGCQRCRAQHLSPLGSQG
jgi:hypothetical protein